LLRHLQGSFPRRGGALNERDKVSIEGGQVLRPVFLFGQKMYLGIDFLITSELKLYLIEVNVGLPGGAHEYHLTHLAISGSPQTSSGGSIGLLEKFMARHSGTTLTPFPSWKV